ncbi:MAG TPA: hypothetical protein VGA56_19505 [Opitutaceae bacterium]
MKTITLSQAKARLGRLADQAIKTGKPVLIRRGDSILELREKPMIEPIEHFAVGDLPVSATAIELEQLHGNEPGGPDGHV